MSAKSSNEHNFSCYCTWSKALHTHENSSDTAAMMTYSGFVTWPSATLAKTVELLLKLFLWCGILQYIFKPKQHKFLNTTLWTVTFEDPFLKSRPAQLGQWGELRSKAVQLFCCQQSQCFKSQSLSGLSKITALLYQRIQARNVSHWSSSLSPVFILLKSRFLFQDYLNSYSTLKVPVALLKSPIAK